MKVCSIFDLPIQGGRLFEEIGRDEIDLLVFRLNSETIVAYEATCPHAGALMRPDNEFRGILTCPLHQWQFRLEDGQCLNVPVCALKSFPVSVHGLDIHVDLS